MSVQNKLQNAEQHRRERAQTGEEFAAYAERFRQEISSQQREFAETGAQFRETQTGFAAYSETFAADVERKRDTSDLLVSIERLREQIEAAQTEFQEYAGTFAADLPAKRDTTHLADAVATFRAATDTLGEALLTYREAVEADIASFNDDVAARADDVSHARSVLEEYVQAFYGADMVGAAAVETTPPESDDSGFESSTAESGDSGFESSTAESDDSGFGSSTAESDDSGFESSAVGADESTTEGDTTETDASAERESIDEVTRRQAVSDSTGDFEEELAEISYGTLKRAANALGYEDNLNSATKDDLIEFFADKDIEELEAVLDE